MPNRMMNVDTGDKVEIRSPLLEYIAKIQGVEHNVIFDTGCSNQA